MIECGAGNREAVWNQLMPFDTTADTPPPTGSGGSSIVERLRCRVHAAVGFRVCQRLRLPILREQTKGCLCAGAVVVLLAFEMMPTALEVWRSPFVREQLSGDSWIPGKRA